MLFQVSLNLYIVLPVFVIFSKGLCQKFLIRQGRTLHLNGEKVFLSGMNQAWVHYSNDFGNGGYKKSKGTLYKTLNIIHKSGGNSMRVWLHVDGQHTPDFDSHGYVTGPGLSLINDLKDFLTHAQKLNVLVNICLWNGAVYPSSRLTGLIEDDAKLTSYIQKALIPMVTALSHLRALASWEIMNEPEGCIKTAQRNAEPCFDTSNFPRWLFADWTGAGIPLERMLRFIGRQVDAIHSADSKALVTVGIWTFKSIATSLYTPNYYSDDCLAKASRSHHPGLDYYQLHTYELEFLHIFWPHAPFTTTASFYDSAKPIVIGEFSSKEGAGMTSPQQFLWAYEHGYCGAWSWSALGSDDAADNITVQEEGMGSLRGRDNQTLGGRVAINLNDLRLSIISRLISFAFNFDVRVSTQCLLILSAVPLISLYILVLYRYYFINRL